MKLAILLRTDERISYFKKALLLMTKIPGEELYFCSGSFSDITKNETLIENIKKGFEGFKDPKLISLGIRVHCDPGVTCLCKKGKKKCASKKCNICKYKDFAKAFKLQSSEKFSYKAYIDNNYSWHSKIYLKINNGEVVAAIIGSSNLTIPAFGEKEDNIFSYNYAFPSECDVLIWDEEKLGNILKGEEMDGIITAIPENDVKSMLANQLSKIKNRISDDKSTHELEIQIKRDGN